MKSMPWFTGCLILAASMAFAGPGVEVEASTDTVMKVKYTGGSPTGNAPAVTVEGKKYGLSVKSSGTYGYAVRGEASGTGSMGILGVGQEGVHGTSSVNDGVGVFGGVYYSSGGAGVHGETNVSGSIGVRGQSPGIGILGTGGDTYSTGVKGVVSDDYSNAIVGESEGYGSNGVVGIAGTSGSGVYGSGDAGLGSYAGVFNGNVYISGVCSPCSPSDPKFKKNIHPLQGGLQKVLALEPKSYEMEVDKYKGQISFSRGVHIGLMSDEVSKVIPEVVHDIKSPALRNGGSGAADRIDFQAINYSSLIPVLISAIKEQQAQIEELKRQIKP
jgi:hypothetical protein